MDPALLKQRQDFMKQAIRSMDTMKQIRTDGQTQSSVAQANVQKKKKKPVAAPQPIITTTVQAKASTSDVQNAANFRFYFPVLYGFTLNLPF
jgi:hypothetical protein